MRCGENLQNKAVASGQWSGTRGQGSLYSKHWAFGFELPEKLSPQRHRVTENKFSCSSFLWLRALVVKREVVANAPARPAPRFESRSEPFFPHLVFKERVLSSEPRVLSCEWQPSGLVPDWPQIRSPHRTLGPW